MPDIDEYFCPKCGSEMAKDIVRQLGEGGPFNEPMPTLSTIMIGIDILTAAGCPWEKVKPVYEWAKDYGKNKFELNNAEKDKLALLKWQRSVQDWKQG